MVVVLPQVFAEQYLERCSETTSINQVEILRQFRRTNARHRRSDQAGSASDVLLSEALYFWHQGAYGFEDETALRTPPPPTSAGFFKGIRLKNTYSGF